jgi:hypothetical protein
MSGGISKRKHIALINSYRPWSMGKHIHGMIGRSAKHTRVIHKRLRPNLHTSVGTKCNCDFNLWCEYPALTEVTLNGAGFVAPNDLKNYISNIIAFVKSFNTDSIVLRLQAPKIQLDWSIMDTSGMYQALTGTGTYGATLTPAQKEKTFPFYSLDPNDTSTMGYLVHQLKQIKPSIKIYLIPYVGFDSGYPGPFSFIQSLSSTIPNYTASTDNQNAVDSFWCAVHFYNKYNLLCKSFTTFNFDGVIIETEDSQLNDGSGVIIPGLQTHEKEVTATYSLFSTAPQSSLVAQGIFNYANLGPTPTDITAINFGLTGSPSISKTTNQINTVWIGSNKINITTLWPQYYNLGDTKNPVYKEQPAYSSFSKKRVTTYLKHASNWVDASNVSSAEVMGMLSIETNYIRKYHNSAVKYNNLRPPFFGQKGWTWNDLCYVANNAIASRKLDSGKIVKPTIYSGAILSADLGKNETTGAQPHITTPTIGCWK